jgi:adenylate kinase family enzyme
VKKILIIGSGGAGKSTLACELGTILGLEVIHLDAWYWNPGWVETPKAEWQNIIQDLTLRESWIMDGNYGGTLDVRLSVADTVIFLDFPRLLCLSRVIKRRFIYAGQSRPDMASDCPERLKQFAIRNSQLRFVTVIYTPTQNALLDRSRGLKPPKFVKLGISQIYLVIPN